MICVGYIGYGRALVKTDQYLHDAVLAIEVLTTGTAFAMTFDCLTGISCPLEPIDSSADRFNCNDAGCGCSAIS